VHPDKRIIFLVGRDDSRFHRALRGAALVGMDRVVGWGGPEIIQHWIASGRKLMTTTQLDPKTVDESARVIVDVRGQTEWDEGHVPGAKHAFLGDLLAQLDDVSATTPIVTYCGGGSRSAIAASLLQAAGFVDVANMKGGMDAWREAGLEVDEG
jgi:hydroxyacylglutathione hydrolase